MKKLLIILLTLISSITYSQTGVGYLNYTVYNIVGNQVGAYPNDATQFTNMLDVTKGASIYTTGSALATTALRFQNQWTPSGVPNGGAYTGIKIEGYFVPKESGVYIFGIDGDDGVDFSLDGVVVTSFYGGHGFGGYRYGTANLVAGKSYKFMARYQNWGGGWGMYLVWKRPSQTTYSVQADEVTNIANIPSKQAKINFDFGSTLDKTKLSVGGTALTSNGLVDVTNSLDSNKVGNGNKAIVVPGQVEWSVMNLWNGVNYIFIDGRKLNGVQPTDVTQVKVLDLYEGPVTFYSWDGTWAVYSLPVLVSKLSDGTSAYNSLIRPFGIYYGLSCDVSFTSVQRYKPQSVTMTTTNTLTTMYNSIVTVSDVYLAFKELSNGGLFGNQTGNEFTYGIQYKNADVNDDGVFDESDTYRLLQHLTGVKNIVDTFTFPNLLKLIPTTEYNTIGKSNWNTSPSYLGNVYNFDINTGKPIDTFNISGTWKGDVNLSHSATPASNGITTMSLKTMNITSAQNVEADILMEKIGENIVTTIKINSNGNQIGATQFEVYFDNSVLDYLQTNFNNSTSTNFSKNTGSAISLGTLNTSNNSIGDVEYKIVFKPKTAITNLLGLISVENVETIDTKSNKLTIKII